MKQAIIIQAAIYKNDSNALLYCKTVIRKKKRQQNIMNAKQAKI